MKLNGLKLDNSFSSHPLNSWGYAKNILISKGYQELECEKGNTQIYDAGSNYDILAIFNLPDGFIIFMRNVSTNIAKIGKLTSSGTLTTYIDTYLNLSSTIGSNIDFIYYYDRNNTLIFAWTDGVLPPMYLNTSKIPTLSSSSDLTKLYLFPEFKHPNYDVNTILTGSLKVGCYYITSCYEIEDGVNSNFGIISNPIFLNDHGDSDTIDEVSGAEVGKNSNKGLEIKLRNIDQNFDYIKIAIIYQTDTSIESFITSSYKITSNQMNFYITSINDLSLFSIEEIINSNPTFNKVQSFSIANNRLRIANVETFSKNANNILNFIASIETDWVCMDDVELSKIQNSYKDPIFTFNNRSFKFDEVYALYIAFRLKTGGYFGIFHLPGRTAISSENINEIAINDTSYKEFRINSSVGVSTAYTESDPISNMIIGKMGFWENDNETYENKYGTILANNKVRHHRFPSLATIHSIYKDVLDTGVIDKTELLVPQLINYTSYTLSISGSPTYINYIHLDFPSGLPSGFVYTKGTTTTPDKFTITDKDFKFKGNLIISSLISIETIQFFEFDIKYNGSSIITGGKIEFSVQPLAAGYDNTYILNFDINFIKPSSSPYDIQIIFKQTAEDGINNFTLDGTLALYNTDVTDVNTYYKHKILGIKLNIPYYLIPSEILQQCDGFELLYAKRTLNDSIILDQSLTKADGIYTRFYGFDSMSNKLDIKPNFIRSRLKYKNNNLDFDLVAKYDEVDEIKYLPYDNIASTPSNEGKENCYVIKTKNNINLDNCLSELISYKTNVYVGFDNKNLVSTGKIAKLYEPHLEDNVNWPLPNRNPYYDANKTTFQIIYVDNTDDGNIQLVGYVRKGIIEKNLDVKVGDLLYIGEAYNGSNVLITNLIGYSKIINLYYEGDNNGYFHIVLNRKKTIINSSVIFGVNENQLPTGLIPIPFSYGGDTFISTNSILKYTLLNLKSYAVLELSGSAGLITLRLRASLAIPKTDYYIPTAGDYIKIEGVTGGTSGTFNGEYRIASVDKCEDKYVTLTYQGSGEGNGELANLKISYYKPELITYPIQSISNIGFRQEGNNNYEKFYPKTNILKTEIVNNITRYKYLSEMKLAQYANYYIYDKSWNLLNNFKQGLITNSITIHTNIFKNRIYSTLPMSSSATATNWRKVKALDYVDIPSDKGEITKLLGHDNILFIVCKYGIKRGAVTDSLKSGDGIDISLKSTDIFENKVEDLFDSPNEYLEIVNKKSVIFTPFGLIALNKQLGQIFIITDKVQEITNTHINDWLKNKLNTTTFTTNQLQNNILLGFDSVENRLFLTVTTGSSNITPNSNFTISYDLIRNLWVSFHDYIPKKYINNKDGMFYNTDKKLFQMHKSNYNYFEGLYYPSIVDFIFNNDNEESVLLNSVSWITNIETFTSNVIKNIWNDTISKIAIFTKNQNTGLIDVNKKEVVYNNGVIQQNGNTQFNKGHWTFSDISDIVTLASENQNMLTEDFEINNSILNTNKNWYEKAKLIAKGFIVRMVFIPNGTTNRRIRFTNININTKRVL